MSNTSEKILEKIEQGGVTPKAKWKFIAERYSIRTLAFVSLVLGSLAFSLILFLLMDQDWNIRQAMGTNWFRWLFLSLPIAWIIFFLLFLATVYFSIRHFKKGYKYPAYFIVLSALITVVFFGSLAAGLGLHQKIHSLFTRRLPFYPGIFDARINNWEQPTAGLIAGQIVLPNKDGFELKDFRGQTWEIQVSEETILPNSDDLSIGEMVKIIGQKLGQNNFKAQEIRFWERGERFAPPGAGGFHPGARHPNFLVPIEQPLPDTSF